MRTRVPGAAAALIFTATFVLAAAQAPQEKAKPAPSRAAGVMTTARGVYTAQQAMRGEQTYTNACVSCHPSGFYATPAFRQKWNGEPLSKLFDFVTEMMPKNEPGSLQDAEYAQVIAYMLRINGAPAGREPLPASSAALRRIRIEFK